MSDAATYIPPIPKPAKILGFAGLIPFAAGALVVWVLPEFTRAALNAQAIYAAIILSFLGGVQWGFAAAGIGPGAGPSWERLGWSVLPALFGWAALFVGEGPERLVVLMLAFLAVFVIDRRWTQMGRGPVWYARLRRDLTAVVVMCLGLTLMRVVLG